MAIILIVDDHQIYLDGLEMIINQYLPSSTIIKAHDQLSADIALRKHPAIDLLLLDLNLQNQNGLDTWKALTECHGALPVAILSASSKDQDIKTCKDAGALGFINKSISNDSLITAIKHLLDGQLHFPYNLEDIPTIQLTPRQKQVLNLLAEGLPNKTICKNLKMSEATVKTHLRALFTIFNVNTRTQCVNVANKYQLI